VTGLRDQLMALWTMSPGEVLEALKFIHAEKPSEEQLRRSNATLCEVIVEGAGAATAATLAEIAEDNLGRTLTATVIWSELERRGLHRVALHDVETVATRIGEATEIWRRSVTREHLDPAIARSETAALIEGLRGADRFILLAGSAGSGKSGVAQQVLEAWRPSDGRHSASASTGGAPRLRRANSAGSWTCRRLPCSHWPRRPRARTRCS